MHWGVLASRQVISERKETLVLEATKELTRVDHNRPHEERTNTSLPASMLDSNTANTVPNRLRPASTLELPQCAVGLKYCLGSVLGFCK